MRKRLIDEKDAIAKCHECSINFKLSEGGWFPEVMVLDERPATRRFNRMYDQLRQNDQLSRWINAMPKVKNRMQQMAVRMQQRN